MKKNNRILFLILFLSIASGLVCDYFYKTSPHHAIRIEEFQDKLHQKETIAEKTLEELKQIIIHSSVDSLIFLPIANNDISYYVFSNDALIFWSDNHLDISNISIKETSDWHFIQLPNAYCVSSQVSLDSIRIVALINVKNNYPYQNDELRNNFARGFNIDEQVQLVNGSETDKLAVFCLHGNYLFTLSEPQNPIYNEMWAIGGLVSYALAILIFFFIYIRAHKALNKNYLDLKTFIILSVSVGILVGLGLFFNVPTTLFLNKLFTPFQYASNPLLASIIHLTVTTVYFLSTLYLFYSHVSADLLNTKTGRIVTPILFLLYFGLVYYVLSGLIYHSSIQITILQFNDFSAVTLWVHFIILLWGIGLALFFYKTHCWIKTRQRLMQALVTECVLIVLLFIVSFIFLPDDSTRITLSFATICVVFYLPYLFPKQKNLYAFIVWWTLVFAAFVVWNSIVINGNKKNDKYKILAQNIQINGNTENDRMADILLEELDIQISNDQTVGILVSSPDSIEVANEYLNKTYLRGFWNKYDMRLNAASKHTDLYNEYFNFVAAVGVRLKDTHFYSVPATQNNISYIGVFPAISKNNDSVFFFMEFYPRSQFKSYSFPNLLVTSTPDILTQLDIAVAKYENKKLVYSSGKVEYAKTSEWIPERKTDFFVFVKNSRKHYVYAPNETTHIVITEQQTHSRINILLYFIYIFLAYLSLCSLIIWTYLFIRRKGNYRLGFTTKFQYAFISLLVISFLLIFYVSVNFIEKKYQDEQIANLESKKNYIQKALQEMYYWNQDLNALNTQALNFDLQDLSYIYRTDIHVFNNLGILVGSSQPLIFNKSLISNRISPTPYFKSNANVNQYEHIGKLNYLTGYTDFYNGDYLQIGYIAIPQFFSQNEIRTEIESFLAVIVHIYLIIIVLAILLSLFIGKQLSAPLNMIESKLKEMRLGRRNEKIDYAPNDEIGQLVMQYNRTVDELEQSAKLLAQSERETAWKSMARQVAHEINNPLTPMKLTIQQLRRTKSMNDERFDDYFEKSTGMLIEQIDNLSRIAGTFSNFARMPEANFERVDIAAKLNSVVQLFANNNEQIELRYTGSESSVYVYADPEQLVQVFNNLLKNAIQAIPAEREGIIKVNLRQTKHQVIIAVTDNGIGIHQDIHDKLFVPNFTTKNTGMGLGLAIAKNIIEVSGGTIQFETKLNESTTFTIHLPKASDM